MGTKKTITLRIKETVEIYGTHNEEEKLGEIDTHFEGKQRCRLQPFQRDILRYTFNTHSKIRGIPIGNLEGFLSMVAARCVT